MVIGHVLLRFENSEYLKNILTVLSIILKIIISETINILYDNCRPRNYYYSIFLRNLDVGIIVPVYNWPYILVVKLC